MSGMLLSGVGGTVKAQSVTPSTLLDDLVAYWKMEEATGETRIDATGNGNDLNNFSGDVARAAGRVGFAAEFAAGNFLSPLDSSGLGQSGSFTISAWVNFDSLLGGAGIVWKFFDDPPHEYRLYYDQAAERFGFDVSADGENWTSIAADNFGVAPLSTWIHVLGVHENGVSISIRVNNGTPDTAAHLTGVFDGGAQFGIGTDINRAMEGRIDEVGIWNRLLTADERTELYNAGAGVTYPFS